MREHHHVVVTPRNHQVRRMLRSKCIKLRDQRGALGGRRGNVANIAAKIIDRAGVGIEADDLETVTADQVDGFEYAGAHEAADA